MFLFEILILKILLNNIFYYNKKAC